ncbi:hypothetical protein VP1G_02534 [Cytospora mali]|uniref:OTU domain-containing protein n=1 Tax=Cytospora mali TaxID=578113 RepID=A0A194UU31_CYTMA|nr:hypothetical protein VP1G_02534 [Valsa mali var. pyri (nom. inval.)]
MSDSQQGASGASARGRGSLWLEDLNSIRRDSPIYNGVPSVVTIRQSQPQSQPQQQGSPVKVVTLDDDSDDNPDPQPHPPQQQGNPDNTITINSDSDDGPVQEVTGGTGNNSSDDQIWGYARADIQAYYGLQGLPRARAVNLLGYQTGYAPQADYPSPTSGLRFDVAQLRRDIAGNSRVRQREIDEAYSAQNFAYSAPLPFEEAITRNWLAEAPELVRGFPMVEEVEFLLQPNMAGASSNCFFKAVALVVYGDHTFYGRVKAEHLQLFDVALRWEHPRHGLYHQMNARFYSTVVTGPGGARRTVANIYQMLTVPSMYTALDVFDITADLYNLFIVVYTLDGNNEVTNVTTMGSYNARHVFICHVDGNHFKPMIPNEYYASEFQLPRITYQSTRGYPMTSRRDENKHALDHSWRNRWAGKLDRRQGALPVEHAFYQTTLTSVMRGTQLRQ